MIGHDSNTSCHIRIFRNTWHGCVPFLGTSRHLVISEFSEIPGTGASRFWGHPDLPQGNDWPAYTGDDGNEYPYVFMCQINLKDIAHYDTCRIGGSISDKDDVKVMYFPDCSILEENRYHGSDGPT